MLNARTIALVAAALACCSAAARASDPPPAAAANALSLPEPAATLLLGAALAGLAHLGRRRR